MRALVITLAFLFSTSALAKGSRDSLTIKLSPRDRFIVWLSIHDHAEQGEDGHGTLVRLRKALGFSEIEKRVAAKKQATSEGDFPGPRRDVSVFRDDLEHLIAWINQSSQTGQLAEATEALEDEWRAVLAAK